MSSTGDAVILEARVLMGDNNTDDPIVADDLLRLSVNTQVSRTAKDLGVQNYWIRSVITTDTTNFDYTLPTTVQYGQVLHIQYNRDNLPIAKVPRADLMRSRAGMTSTTRAGRQFICALDLAPDQSTVLMFVYRPSEAEGIDIYVNAIPDFWVSGPGTPPTIPFSQATMRAIALRVAADVVGTLGPDRMIALALNPNVPQKWEATASQLIRNERIYQNGIKRAKLVSRVGSGF
jgi:hypothetical protein